jgi:hypothetical protein
MPRPSRLTPDRLEAAWAVYQTHSLRQTARVFRVCARRLAHQWRAAGRVVRSSEATWAVKPRRAPTEREQSIGWYYGTHSLRETGHAFGLTESGVRGVLRRVGVRCRSRREAARRAPLRGMARRAVDGRALRRADGCFQCAA